VPENAYASNVCNTNRLLQSISKRNVLKWMKLEQAPQFPLLPHNPRSIHKGTMSCAQKGLPFLLQCCMYAKESSPGAPRFVSIQTCANPKLISMLFALSKGPSRASLVVRFEKLIIKVYVKQGNHQRYTRFSAQQQTLCRKMSTETSVENGKCSIRPIRQRC
jgi:hypothetical protein